MERENHVGRKEDHRGTPMNSNKKMDDDKSRSIRRKKGHCDNHHDDGHEIQDNEVKDQDHVSPQRPVNTNLLVRIR